MLALVDDDISVRESVEGLLTSMGFEVEVYASADAFLDANVLERVACIILDVQMPGMTGPELQDDLNAAGRAIPIVFITSHRDDALRVRVMDAGAVACLYKPFDESALVAALETALSPQT